MNNDNTRKLFKRFKFLNKQSLPDEFACGDGWYKLVYDMCKELKLTNLPLNFVVTKVEEKYGDLKVHTKNGTMQTRVIMDQYNTISIDLCDECGNKKCLEMCDKCTVPEIEYPEDEPDEEDDQDSNCSDSCAGGCSGGTCGTP